MRRLFFSLGILLFLAVGCNTSQVAVESEAPPTPIGMATSTTRPTDLPSPTAIPLPTDTPVPTLTPTMKITTIRVKNLFETADLRIGKGPVYSQDWSPDGRWLVTADTEQVRVWNTTTYKEVNLLAGHTDFIWGLAWSPVTEANLLASASQDGSVLLWNMATYTQTALLETGWAFCVDWSIDGKQLAVGTNNGEVQIWDVAAGQLLQTLTSKTHTPVISIAWSPDGKTIVSGEWGGGIYWWDSESGQVRQTITDYTEARSDVNGLAWSPDGSILASAHQDGQIRLWNTESFELVGAIKAHTGWARGLAFSPDGRMLATTGEDKRICLWDVATGQEYAEQHHNWLPVWSTSWSPDGKYIASGGGAYEEPHVGATIVWRVP